MVPALRPGLDQHALDGGGSTAEPDPTASDRLRPFSLRSTERRQDGWSRARTEASPDRALRGAWIPLIVVCVHRSMGGVSPMCRCPSPVPVCPGAWIAPDRGKPLAFGICHAPCLLPGLPVPGDGGAFPPCQGVAGIAIHR